MVFIWKVFFTAIGCVSAAPAGIAQPILNTSSTFGHLGHPDGFNFPTLGKLGNEVLFQGSFGNSFGLLVFGAHGAGLEDSVFNSSKILAFGDSSLATAHTLSSPRLLAFVATTRSSANEPATDSLILQAKGLGSVAIATTGQTLKLANVTLTRIDAPMVSASEDGKVAYVAFTAFGSAASGWNGIILAAVTLDAASFSTPTLTLVADSSTLIPGKPKKSNAVFKCLSSSAVSMRADVVFFGSNCSYGKPGSSAVAAQRAGQMMYRTRQKHAHSLAHAGDIFAGIFHWSQKAGVTVVADSSTTVPGFADTFEAYSDPAIGSDGRVAFVASTSSGQLGVFLSGPSGLSVVATTSTIVPGTGGQVFSDFPYVPSVGAEGEVFFYASVSGLYSGVYSGVASRSGSKAATVQAQLTQADKVDGQALAFIGFGTNAYSEMSDVFATYLVLNNGVDGVWTFSRKGAGESEKQILV